MKEGEELKKMIGQSVILSHSVPSNQIPGSTGGDSSRLRVGAALDVHAAVLGAV